MKIETYTESSCFTELAPEWHSLLEVATTNHLFITPEFQKSWWETLGTGELRVITFRLEDGQLVGLAPLFQFENEQHEQQVSFVGCVNVSDYLDFIVHPHYADQVYTALTQVLTNNFSGKRPLWQKLFLCSIPHTSPTLITGVKQFRSAQWQVEQTQQDVCPTLQLPKTWEEYLQQVGKKQRHEIRRKWEKLFRETHAQFELIDSPHEITTAIHDFIRLHQKSNEDKKNFWDADHVKFFESFALSTAEKGWLKLYFLKIGEKRVASMLGFDYNQQFFLYNSGFDAEEYRQLSVGYVLTAFTIQQAIERGLHTYDFLRGDEEYKFRFGAVSEPIFDLSVTKSS